jgi:O-antigen/teichoic acid export membrane protein
MNSVSGTDSANLGLRKLAVNIGQTLGRQFFALLLGLGTVTIIARILGPTGNGQYAITMLLPSFLASFLNLGIAPANVYYVGRHSVTPGTAIGVNTRIWLVLAVVGTTIGALAILFFGEVLFSGVPSSLLWIALLGFPLGLLQGYMASLLQAVQNFQRYNLAIIASPVVLFVLVSISLLFGGGIVAVVISSVIVHAVNLIITWSLIRPILLTDFKIDPDYRIDANNYAKEVVQYGYRAHLSNILAFINYRADVFLVNLLLNPAATGVYVIAVTMSEKLWVLSQAVSTVMLPRLSELHTEEITRRQLTPFMARWVLIITTLAAGLLAIVSPFLITMLFGELYLDAVVPLLLLLPGIIMGSLSRVLANDIAARGRPELNMYTAVIVVITNIAGNFVLIPLMGLSGAALATTIAYSLNCIFRIWIYSSLSQNYCYKIFAFDSHDAKALRQLRNLSFKLAHLKSIKL